MNTLLIYSPLINNRISYTLKLVFENIIGLSIRTTTNLDEFIAYEKAKLSYADFDNEIISIKNSKLLNSYSNFEPEEFSLYKKAVSDNCLKSYDYLALVFFLVSRIEEYDSKDLDMHKRFRPESSYAFQNGFLQEPLVNQISEFIKKQLLNKYPDLEFKIKRPESLLSFDIDVAFKYKCRPLYRTLGSMGKDFIDLKFNEIFDRFSTLTGLKSDPFDVYDFLEEISKNTDNKMMFFIQTSYQGVYDKAVNFKSEDFRKLLKQLSRFAEIGIHPSYIGGQSSESIIKEKAILEEIIGKTITKSRQHFLRLLIPSTLNTLVDAGINDDYSMAYASKLGWRASCCSSFNLFDCNDNVELQIKSHPISFMDGTINEYLELKPDEALKEIEKIYNQTVKFNSEFIPLWHNDSLSETGNWKNWRNDVFINMLRLIKG